MAFKAGLSMNLKANQRLALLGRMRMAEWIEMPEKEFARQVEETEKDPLFQKLFFGSSDLPGAIRRQRWPGGRLSSSFYEGGAERVIGKGERVQVEEMLGEQARLLPLIRKMGQKDFERYFLHGEEAAPLEKIAEATALKLEEVQGIHRLLLELGAQSEFCLPSREPTFERSYACLARISFSEDEPVFEFYSPYWARGLYQIHYDSLENWKRSQQLSGAERKRMRHLIKKVETLNLRQNTLFRILESLTKLQFEYLRTRDETRLRPVSLRTLAKRLELAPSTVSRAMTGRSVHMPWGREAPLASLVPGQRRVLREVMAQWLEEGVSSSDASFTERLRKEYGIKISRRTVNAVRNELRKPSKV